VEIGRQVSLL